MHPARKYLTVGLVGLVIAALAVLAPHPLVAVGAVPLVFLVLGPPLWSLRGAFASLWFVRIEAAPTDVLMVSGIALLGLRGKLIIRPTPMTLLTAAYALLNLVQILTPGSSTLYAMITVYLCVLAIGLSSLPLGGLDRMMPMFHFSALVTAVLLLVLGVLFYAGQLPAAVIPWVMESGRVSGLFKDPNVAAPFVATTWIYVAERYLKGGRTGFLVVWFALIPSLIIPFSRGAFLYALIALGVLFVIYLRTGPRRVVTMALTATLLGGVLAGALVPLVVQIGQNRFLQTQTRYDSDRRGAWIGGAQASVRYPLGVGPGATRQVMTEFHPRSVPMNTHQTYLQVLAENGVLGLALFLGILAVGLKNAWQRRFTGRGWVCAALVGLVIESFVVDTLHWRLLWILLALSTVSPPSDQQGVQRHETAVGDAADPRRSCEVGIAGVGSITEQGIQRLGSPFAD